MLWNMKKNIQAMQKISTSNMCFLFISCSPKHICNNHQCAYYFTHSVLQCGYFIGKNPSHLKQLASAQTWFTTVQGAGPPLLFLIEMWFAFTTEIQMLGFLRSLPYVFFFEHKDIFLAKIGFFYRRSNNNLKCFNSLIFHSVQKLCIINKH